MKTYKKTFKFICHDCGKFSYTDSEYCEVCGSSNMRKALKEDYLKFEQASKKEHKKIKTETDKIEKAEKKSEKEAKKAKK